MCDNHISQGNASSKTVSRRELLKKAGIGLGALAGASLLPMRTAAAATATAPKASMLPQIALIRPKNAAEGAICAQLDDTHAIVDGAREFLLWPGDREMLDEAGIDYDITVPDITEMLQADVKAQRAPLQQPAGGEPPGFYPRTDYRRLVDYETELQALPTAYPGLAELMVLNRPTLEGRQVFGVEIGSNAGAQDGKPITVIDGVHHSREWPAGEYPMIFAHYLLQGYGKDPRITSLLDRSRVVIVPIMNPDGFNYSRNFVTDADPAGGMQSVAQGSMWRKNRRVVPGPVHPPVKNNPMAYGVDPNRNYPLGWGGQTRSPAPVLNATSPFPTDATYYGEGPMSEPETANIGHLGLTRNVTAYISNHTYGRLVLRPWGDTTVNPFDFDLLKGLGDLFGGLLAYTSQIGLQLYATTGAASDWMYAANGAISYTFEHGDVFHPPFMGPQAPGTFWPKVMEAYTIMAEHGADPEHHCVLRGRVVDAGALGQQASLQLHREFDIPITPLSADHAVRGIYGWGHLTNPNPNDPTRPVHHEVQDLTMATDPDGSFEWHVGPSTCPLDASAGRQGQYALTAAGSAGTFTQPITVARGQQLDLGDIVLS